MLSDKSVGCASNVKCMISICVLSDGVFVGYISKQYVVRLLVHFFFSFSFFGISAGNNQALGLSLISLSHLLLS